MFQVWDGYGPKTRHLSSHDCVGRTGPSLWCHRRTRNSILLSTPLLLIVWSSCGPHDFRHHRDLQRTRHSQKRSTSVPVHCSSLRSSPPLWSVSTTHIVSNHFNSRKLYSTTTSISGTIQLTFVEHLRVDDSHNLSPLFLRRGYCVFICSIGVVPFDCCSPRVEHCEVLPPNKSQVSVKVWYEGVSLLVYFWFR